MYYFSTIIDFSFLFVSLQTRTLSLQHPLLLCLFLALSISPFASVCIFLFFHRLHLLADISHSHHLFRQFYLCLSLFNSLCICTHIQLPPVYLCQDGSTSLMSASFEGHNAVVQLLLNEGANIDMMDNVSLRHNLPACIITHL